MTNPQAAFSGCTTHRWTLMLAVTLGTAALAPTAALAAASARAPSVRAAQLAKRLQQGGYVLVLRHAQSPDAPPSAQAAEPGNPHHERQLDSIGKANARALGDALHRLDIPIGAIYSSPTYRALETLKLAGLGPPATSPELAEGSQGMHSDSDVARSSWLRHAVAIVPSVGTDTLIVTHTPNIMAAFGKEAADIAAGETLVFRPDGNGASTLVARIKIGDWASLRRADCDRSYSRIACSGHMSRIAFAGRPDTVITLPAVCTSHLRE